MKYLFGFILLLTISSLQAQLALKVNQFRPAGRLGGAMKKAVSFEIMYMSDPSDETWRSRFGFGYVNMHPRLDTFHTVSYMYENGKTTVYPGYEIYRHFDLAYLFAGFDYMELQKNNFTIYPGIDLLGGGYSASYLKKNVIGTTDAKDGWACVGTRFRAGVHYAASDQLHLNLEFQRAATLLTNYQIYTFGEIGFVAHYIF
ncbi:MAG: hypothetical protein KG003_09065 [Bacteroidetes bacterium]|nr:hypothetical protein [Bacteroidota bacterium]